ncbi:MAG: hypothetical protein WBM65_17435 [Sedimenticolaceae bacterium]
MLPTPVFPSFIGTFVSFVWQFLVTPFRLKDCEARPRLFADITHLPIKPFNGAHALPLSCFCPQTGADFDLAAKRKGFDVSLKQDNQFQAYTTAATWLRADYANRATWALTKRVPSR